MDELLPIDKEVFEAKSWKKLSGFHFAAGDSVCPIGFDEVAAAAASVPVAFVENDSGYSLVVVLGFESGKNAYLDAQGRWLNNFIPELYQNYPFTVARNAANENELIFCIHGKSGALLDDKSGEPFFDEDGELTPKLKKSLQALAKNHISQTKAAPLLAILNDLNLIKPLKIAVEFPDGKRNIEGVHGIDEKALKDISNEDFLRLRAKGLLPLIYCQLLSMRHLVSLSKLAKLKINANAIKQLDELSFDSSDDSGNISFDNL
jgi:hypothetical protein